MTLGFLPLEASGAEGGYKAPSVKDFYFDSLFGISQVDRTTFQAILGAVIVIVVWVIAARRLSVVPTKKQFAMEYIYDFVRNSVAKDVIGHDFRKFLPYLLALFSFILVNNWFGELFFFMFPTFSRVGYAYGLALVTLVVYISVGVKKHGLKYFKMAVLPEGVPWYLWGLIIPLEFLSNFITRPITLALRLFANLFAGHLVVLVFVVGGGYLISRPDNLFHNVAGGVSLLFSVAILLLELFIGALQAYIFTVLTAQYISSSLSEAH